MLKQGLQDSDELNFFAEINNNNNNNNNNTSMQHNKKLKIIQLNATIERNLVGCGTMPIHK